MWLRDPTFEGLSVHLQDWRETPGGSVCLSALHVLGFQLEWVGLGASFECPVGLGLVGVRSARLQVGGCAGLRCGTGTCLLEIMQGGLGGVAGF